MLQESPPVREKLHEIRDEVDADRGLKPSQTRFSPADDAEENGLNDQFDIPAQGLRVLSGIAALRRRGAGFGHDFVNRIFLRSPAILAVLTVSALELVPVHHVDLLLR